MSGDDRRSLGEIAALALDVAREAGDVILPLFQSVDVEVKPDGSHVTAADRRAEEHIRNRLTKEMPQAAVLGEELGGEKRALPGDQWVIDPLDGTTPFVLGLPLFGVLLGLLRDGEPVVGVIHLAAMGETLWAWKGGGCWYRRGGGAAARVSCDPVGSLGRAFVSVSGVHGSELDPLPEVAGLRLQPLVARAHRFRVVGDCVQHALVCRGRLHLAVDAVMQPWDTAALVPCVREAGGVASTLGGDERDVVYGGDLVSASDRALHREALAAMAT